MRQLRLQRTIRSGRLADADLEHLAEEIGTLGRSEAAALRSAYRLIAMHLPEMIVQPERQTASWINPISRERLNVEVLLEDDPGLAPRRQVLFDQACRVARREAALEIELPLKTFPSAPPFTLDEAERETYWPPGTR